MPDTPNPETPAELAAKAARCPFCGRAPRLSARHGTTGEDFSWYAFAACFCGGFSACAHKMAGADTEEEALRLVLIDWNTRRYDLATLAASSTAPADTMTLQEVWDLAGGAHSVEAPRREWVEALLHELDAAKPKAPPGFVLVPVEPTEAMLDASDPDCHKGRAYSNTVKHRARQMRRHEWDRMLAAAPAAAERKPICGDCATGGTCVYVQTDTGEACK